MTLKNFFLATAIVSWTFGIGLLFMPDFMASLHGESELTNFGRFITRMLGGALLSTGVLGWFSKNLSYSEATKAILITLMTTDGLYSLINIQDLFQNGGGEPFQYLELATTLIFTFAPIYFLRKHK